MKTFEKIIDSVRLANGFEIDLDEGWNKLASSQFGGSPGRAFSELIQNAIDSYPSGTPWEKRRGEIDSTNYTVRITDYGEGMDTKRLELLATVGGTDKLGDESKIGRFGLGFISIFNPLLKTKKVTVMTRCEGQVVEMIFRVRDPYKKPDISLEVSDKTISFSTSVEVEFSDPGSVEKCLISARSSLSWYPSPMTINGTLFDSEWNKGKSGDYISFTESNLEGLIRKGCKWSNVALLCKYELVMNTYLTHFVNGGYNMKHDLNDYDAEHTPYIPDVDIVFNINNLTLVISRDSYYLDNYYRQARSALIKYLREFLATELRNRPCAKTVVGNHFIFRHELNEYLKRPWDHIYDLKENAFLRLLSEEPVYRINGRPGLHSLLSLRNMITPGIPFWYSTEKSNLRWLGGNFRHDFIVTPDDCYFFNNASVLFDRIFESVFGDVVNLDSITSDDQKIRDLIARGIVDKSALSPNCVIKGMKELTPLQKDTVAGLASLLDDPEIREVIGTSLHIPVSSITPVFFTISEEGAWLSTGLFDLQGKPVSDEYVSNFLQPPDNGFKNCFSGKKIHLLLGLNADHPIIHFLSTSASPHKEYFTLTYIAHELALCQKILVPFSPFYHQVKQKLAQEMRKVLMNNLLSQLNN